MFTRDPLPGALDQLLDRVLAALAEPAPEDLAERVAAVLAERALFERLARSERGAPGLN